MASRGPHPASQLPKEPSSSSKNTQQQSKAAAHEDSGDDDDDDDKTECSVCNVKFKNSEGYQRHIRGLMHTSKLLALNQKATGTIAPQQLLPTRPGISRGSSHAASARAVVENFEDDKSIELRPVAADAVSQKYYCNICNTYMSGYQTAVAHARGKKHEKAKRSARYQGGRSVASEPSSGANGRTKEAKVQPQQDELPPLMAKCTDPVVGLEYLVQYSDSESGLFFVCHLCDAEVRHKLNELTAHLTSFEHRYEFFSRVRGDIFDELAQWHEDRGKLEIMLRLKAQSLDVTSPRDLSKVRRMEAGPDGVFRDVGSFATQQQLGATKPKRSLADFRAHPAVDSCATDPTSGQSNAVLDGKPVIFGRGSTTSSSLGSASNNNNTNNNSNQQDKAQYTFFRPQPRQHQRQPGEMGKPSAPVVKTKVKSLLETLSFQIKTMNDSPDDGTGDTHFDSAAAAQGSGVFVTGGGRGDSCSRGFPSVVDEGEAFFVVSDASDLPSNSSNAGRSVYGRPTVGTSSSHGYGTLPSPGRSLSGQSHARPMGEGNSIPGWAGDSDPRASKATVSTVQSGIAPTTVSGRRSGGALLPDPDGCSDIEPEVSNKRRNHFVVIDPDDPRTSCIPAGFPRDDRNATHNQASDRLLPGREQQSSLGHRGRYDNEVEDNSSGSRNNNNNRNNNDRNNRNNNTDNNRNNDNDRNNRNNNTRQPQPYQEQHQPRRRGLLDDQPKKLQSLMDVAVAPTKRPRNDDDDDYNNADQYSRADDDDGTGSGAWNSGAGGGDYDDDDAAEKDWSTSNEKGVASYDYERNQNSRETTSSARSSVGASNSGRPAAPAGRPGAAAVSRSPSSTTASIRPSFTRPSPSVQNQISSPSTHQSQPPFNPSSKNRSAVYAVPIELGETSNRIITPPFDERDLPPPGRPSSSSTATTGVIAADDSVSGQMQSKMLSEMRRQIQEQLAKYCQQEEDQTKKHQQIREMRRQREQQQLYQQQQQQHQLQQQLEQQQFHQQIQLRMNAMNPRQPFPAFVGGPPRFPGGDGGPFSRPFEEPKLGAEFIPPQRSASPPKTKPKLGSDYF